MKKNMKNISRTLIFFFLIGNCFALMGGGYGSSITTITPTARSIGMGNTGYALSDDETCLQFNPAGLGLMNFRWNGGAVSYTIDKKNNVEIPGDLYTVNYQNENFNKIGFAGCFQRIEYRITQITGGPITEDKFYNLAYCLGVGYRFYSNKTIDNVIGISGNYYQFLHDASWWGSPTTMVLGNIGYILQIQKKFRIGLSFKDGLAFNDVCQFTTNRL
jgi:hypothetical protein